MDVVNILIAPNAFKNSLDAEGVAMAVRDGLMQSKLSCVCTPFPIGDGGDGTGALLIKKMNGVLMGGTVHDPLGRSIFADLGLIDDGGTAVIEMANASGLRLLTSRELDPLKANSFGTGEQIRLALDRGVTKIVIG